LLCRVHEFLPIGKVRTVFAHVSLGRRIRTGTWRRWHVLLFIWALLRADSPAGRLGSNYVARNVMVGSCTWSVLKDSDFAVSLLLADREERAILFSEGIHRLIRS